MELLQLYYFERIAKYQSYTRAAEELHVSQPSLSSCIIRLEAELGAKLFDRKGRKIMLNSYGRYFLTMTQQILTLVNECKMPKDDSAAMKQINVGFMIYNDTMFTIISDYIRENSNIVFNVHGSTLSSPFAYSNYDFIVCQSHEAVAPFHNELFVENLSAYVIVPKKHPLAKKKYLTIGDLRNESFCFLKNENGGYEKEYKECILSGFIPKCEFVTNNSFFKLRYVMQHDVFGFIPAAWKPIYEMCDNIVLIPQKERMEDGKCLLCWSDSTLNSETNQQFLQYVKERLEKTGPGDLKEVSQGSV